MSIPSTRFYQASILRIGGRYLVTFVREVGNPLGIRVDHMTNGPDVMRLPVAPEDAMMAWKYVDPRELTQRYLAHAARERRRIEQILNRLHT